MPDAVCTEVPLDAAPAVRAALERMGKAEDVRFSPGNRRLALADFVRDSIVVVDVAQTVVGDRPSVTLTDATEVSAPGLVGPHGVDFLDEDTLVVANRMGNMVVLRWAADDLGADRWTPVDLPPGLGFAHLDAPGSLLVLPEADGAREVLVCENSGDRVTRYTVRSDPLAVGPSEVVVHRWLDLPDGVAVSADRRWMAVSNHMGHAVMLYDLSAGLDDTSDPVGILRGTMWPHGLRFDAEGRLFVADAGNPYLHVYEGDGDGWRGVAYPAASARVMDDDLFERGQRGNPHEGGPKGIDLDRYGRVLAVSSMCRPLAFFAVLDVLAARPDPPGEAELRVGYELEVLERAQRSKARIAALEGSSSFRLTAPLRRLGAGWSSLRRTLRR